MPLPTRLFSRLAAPMQALRTSPIARVGVRSVSGRAVPKGVIMERMADRPLPDPYAQRKRIIASIPIFLTLLIGAGAGFFNYQKLSTSVVTSSLYSARINDKCREALGDEIQFKNYIPWIWGSINQLHGKIDIEFTVKGTRDWGTLKFKCKRFGGKGGSYRTLVWELVTSDGRVIDLLEEGGMEPMEGGAPIKNAQ